VSKVNCPLESHLSVDLSRLSRPLSIPVHAMSAPQQQPKAPTQRKLNKRGLFAKDRPSLFLLLISPLGPEAQVVPVPSQWCP